jgi:hypothetical protein
MLRCGPQQEETILAEVLWKIPNLLFKHYQESLKYVRKSINVDLKMLNFDWHHNLKQLGPNKSIEGLWSLLKTALEQIDLNEGKVM